MQEREQSRGFFPKVVTSEEQMSFVYKKLIPELYRKQLIREESFAGLIRYSIEKGAEQIGEKAPKVVPRVPGRKTK
jgi:hypothetical protein